MAEALLEVKDLVTHFSTDEGVVKAVDGVSFSIKPGGVLGVVGESGCGKSITALSIMRLVPAPHGRILKGQIYFQGQDLLQKSEKEMQQIRGNQISLISQDPMTSLNPVLTVGEQIMEAIILHQKVDRRTARQRAVEMMDAVNIPSAAARIDDYPHQFSGGMRQRIIIAMALSCQPKLLIADEPTTALDVTIQAQILDLMRAIRQRRGAAILLITHDLGVVAEMCDEVAVMYAGRVVEYTDVYTLFKSPQHPYTMGLLQSIPRLGVHHERLVPIVGQPPSLSTLPSGCHFHPRCPQREEIRQRDGQDTCTLVDPPLYDVEANHTAACLLRRPA